MFVVQQVTVIGAAERLPGAGGRRGVRRRKPVGQASPTQVAHPVQALTDSDSDRRCLCLPGQLGEFLDELVSLGVLYVEAHNLPFYPTYGTKVPYSEAMVGKRPDPGGPRPLRRRRSG